MSLAPQRARDPLTSAIDRASTLLATDPERALAEALALSKAAPQDPRILLIIGSARRRQGDHAGARAVLAPLAKAWSRAALTHFELGLALAGLGEDARAAEALRQALAVKPDLAEAWRALGDCLFRQGDAPGAEAAFAEHERACVRDPALREPADAIFAGDLARADQLLRARLAAAPADSVALRMLGDTLARLARDGEAERMLALSLEIDPGYAGARFGYANALFRQQKGAQALAQARRLLDLDPADPAYRNLAAACLALVGDYEQAIAVYEALLEQYPAQAKIWLNYGHALRTTGRGADTVAAYRRCISLAPGVGEAWWSLANLKTAAFSESDRRAMTAQLEVARLSDEDRLHLCFALGKALEDQRDYAAAFGRYAQGARLRRDQTPYDSDNDAIRVARAKALFTRAFFASRAGGGSPSDAPIFIVGLPRSGSTLVEQILATHSTVEGTQELPDIGHIAGRLDGGEGRYPECLAALAPADLAALGEDYLQLTRLHRKHGRPFFIDKMPNNFHHIGLIQLILPGAKIIDARRHPLGACFSAFKQHFAQGQSFSYDLADLGRYYRGYVELMDHYDAVLPRGRIHRVIYENLVEDTEGEVKRLLAYCGLPFEAGCLRFYENDRAVRTVSSEQVRRPIFRDGLEQWRRFEPWLGPLKDALGPVLNNWR